MWSTHIESRSSINREAEPFAGTIAQSEIISPHKEMINHKELINKLGSNHHECSKEKKTQKKTKIDQLGR